MEDFFANLARCVTWIPKITILIMLLITGVSCIGLSKLELVTDPEILFTPDDSLVTRDQGEGV